MMNYLLDLGLLYRSYIGLKVWRQNREGCHVNLEIEGRWGNYSNIIIGDEFIPRPGNSRPVPDKGSGSGTKRSETWSQGLSLQLPSRTLVLARGSNKTGVLSSGIFVIPTLSSIPVSRPLA